MFIHLLRWQHTMLEWKYPPNVENYLRCNQLSMKSYAAFEVCIIIIVVVVERISKRLQRNRATGNCRLSGRQTNEKIPSKHVINAYFAYILFFFLWKKKKISCRLTGVAWACRRFQTANQSLIMPQQHKLQSTNNHTYCKNMNKFTIFCPL